MPRRFRAIVVGDGVAQTARKPRDRSLSPPQLVAALERVQQTLLEQILRVLSRAHPGREKTMKPGALGDDGVDHSAGEIGFQARRVGFKYAGLLAGEEEAASK